MPLPTFTKKLYRQLALSLLPTLSYAHLIAITPTAPFPPTVATSSTTIATFAITNLAARIPITVIDQSIFTPGSGLSIAASTCGALMAPGQSCLINIQLQASPFPQTIAGELREWAMPSADGVTFPFAVSIINAPPPPPPLLPFAITVGSSNNIDNTNLIPIIYTSNNAGNTWLLSPPLALPSIQTRGALNSVSCVGDNCSAVGLSAFDDNLNNILPLAYSSNNRGRSWTLSADFVLPPEKIQAFLNGVNCLENTCTAVGGATDVDDINTVPVAYVSNDTGATWTIAEPFQIPPGALEATVNSISCVPGRCVAGGISSTTLIATPVVYTSTDNGVNWSLSPPLQLPDSGVQGRLFGMSCVNARCVTVGDYIDLQESPSPLLYTSNNGGETWTLSAPLPLPAEQSQGQLAGVQCNGSACVAVGYSLGFTSTLPLVYVSSDSGQTWQLSDPLPITGGNAGNILSGVTCTGNNCIAVGLTTADGEVLQPLTYSSNNNGRTWVLSSPTILPEGQTQASLTGITSGIGGATHSLRTSADKIIKNIFSRLKIKQH